MTVGGPLIARGLRRLDAGPAVRRARGAAGRARRAPSRLAAALAGAAGLGLLGYGLAVPTKALLGQALLERAFEERLATGEAVKPWPWADMAPMARIGFPRLGETRIVLDRASGEAMAWGPGHVAGTAALGAPGLSAAAAHRDTHFALLEHVKPGDEITLQTADGRTKRYRVTGGEVVDSRDVGLPIIHEGRDVLALSTCWPFGATTPGPMRFVLFAEPIASSSPAI